MLFGIASERRFLPIAGRRLRRLFPRLAGGRPRTPAARQLAPKLVMIWRAIASELPRFHDRLRYLETTPLPYGQSRDTISGVSSRPTAASAVARAPCFVWALRLVLLRALDGTIVDLTRTPSADAPHSYVGL